MEGFRNDKPKLGFVSNAAVHAAHQPKSFEVEHRVGMSASVWFTEEILKDLSYECVNAINRVTNSLDNLFAVYKYSNSILAQYTYRAMQVAKGDLSLHNFYTTSLAVPTSSTTWQHKPRSLHEFESGKGHRAIEGYHFLEYLIEGYADMRPRYEECLKQYVNEESIRAKFLARLDRMLEIFKQLHSEHDDKFATMQCEFQFETSEDSQPSSEFVPRVSCLTFVTPDQVIVLLYTTVVSACYGFDVL